MNDDSDRRPRAGYPLSAEHRLYGQRAASQPPALQSANSSSSPLFVSFRDPRSSDSGSVSPSLRTTHQQQQQQPQWQTRFPTALGGSRPMAMGIPPPPTRSASFSAMSPSAGGLSQSQRDRAFPSTFEDDEDDWLADQDGHPDDLDYGFGERHNGHLHDMTRSRSQSLATPGRLSLNTGAMPIPVGGSAGLPGAQWPGTAESPTQRGASRYGEIGRPPQRMTTSPLGAATAVPIQIQRRQSGYGAGQSGTSSSAVDVSNMSPFVRDVGRAMLEDNAALRELWGSMHGGPVPVEHLGGSGTTSRRHSVSVVQPRARGVMSTGGGGGMNGLGGFDNEDGLPLGFGSGFGSRQLLISDDELASDLGSMLNLNDHQPNSANIRPPQSQPASLPVYSQGIHAPHSPVERGGYVPMNLDRIPRTRQTSHTGHHNGRLASVERRDLSRSPGTSPARPDPASYRQQHAQQLHQIDTTSGLHPQMNTTPQSRYPPSAIQPQSAVDPGLAELGRGVPLHAVPANVPLFVVEFKAGRQDVFYCVDPGLEVHGGDIVIVEADRGRDLGKVIAANISHAQVEALQLRQSLPPPSEPISPGGVHPPPKREINPKRIYGKAQPSDTASMLAKSQDEQKALALCQSKVKQKKLPMEVVDAEYQWDRRKLTFYFIADKRIDFRELVRELFRLYKTRIWMASVPSALYE